MSSTRRPSAGSHENSVAEIRADIAEARSELGDTVQALAAKADVKQQAKDAADVAKTRVTEAAETARHKVTEAAGVAKVKVSDGASALAERAQADPRVRRVATQVRQRPVVIAAAVGAVVLVYLVVRRRRNR